MAYARSFLNLPELPDGTVLAIGGRQRCVSGRTLVTADADMDYHGRDAYSQGIPWYGHPLARRHIYSKALGR
jgi:hypothetical protein